MNFDLSAWLPKRYFSQKGSDWRTAYARIFERGLFDHDWYAETYSCVWEAGLSPLEHFVKYGAALGRKPAATATPAQAEMVRRILSNPGKVEPLRRDPGEPLVSIICITYNHAQYIEQAIQSMLDQQTSFDFEILVGDDCSSDATPEIVRGLAEKHPQIVPVLRTTNIGPNPNFQDLARRVRGKFVAICEGDDFWTDPRKLQKQVDFFEEHPEFTVCFHRARVLYEDFPEVEEYFPEACGSELSLQQEVAQNWIQTNSVMYRWRFGSAQPFSIKAEIVPGDWFTHLLHAKVGRIGYLDDCMSVYRRHSTGMWSPYATELARSRRYGNAEIEFFRSLKEHFGGQYHTHFDKTQRFLFRRLATTFLDDCDVTALHTLIERNGDIAADCMADLGFDPGTIDQKDAESLRECLLRQARISVIVTTYNHAEYIAQCLESILAQEGLLDLQIIVGDDCSTDGTADIIGTFAAAHPDKITFLRRDKNVGMLQNMKQCLALADGCYVAFCEGDDYWLSTRKLSKQLSAVRPDPEVKLCFNWLLLQHVDSDSFEPHAEQGSLLNGEVSFFALARRPLTANFSCCFYRADAIASVPDSYFTGKSSADWLFNLYVANSGKALFLKELLSVYRIQSRGQWSGLPRFVQRSQTTAFRREFAQIFGEGRGFEDLKVRLSSVTTAKPLPQRVRGAVLDWPTRGNWFDLTDGSVTFRGWALDLEGGTTIVVTTGHEIRRIPLDGDRPDVLKSLLGEKHAEAPGITCGFQFTAAFENDLKVTLEFDIDGKRHPWMTLEFEQELINNEQ